jgi:hypothetical protein
MRTDRTTSGLTRPFEVTDAVAVSTLVAATLVVCIPVLRGDLFAYMDLPAHSAEIRDLAREGSTGWTDAGFCGFPIDILQSPLLYRGLALLTRAGVPLRQSIAAAAMAGLAAPALGFYDLARRHMSAAWALGMAATLLFYRGSIAGTSASLAGMFPFHIASGAFLVVMSRLERPTRDLVDLAIVAALAAIIGLSHMYLTIALVYLGAFHLVACARSAEGRKKLAFDVPALALGALGASAYWLPNALARTKPIREVLGLAAPLKRFFTVGFPILDPSLSSLARLAHDPVLGLDALLQAAVLVVALVGVRELVRHGSLAARYGATLAAFVLGALVLQELTGLSLLGPQSWRLGYVLKLGVLAAAVPAVARASRKLPAERLAPVAALVVLGGAFAMERVTASQAVAPTDPAVAEVESLWGWIREHETPAWGRIYLQDTWGRLYVRHDWEGVNLADYRLDASHILASTAEHTGVEQVGAFYGQTPFLTEDWTSAERGNATGTHADRPDLVSRVAARMIRANATHILFTDKQEAESFAADPRFAVEHTTEHYVLLSRRDLATLGDATSHYATANGDGEGLSVERLAPGRMRLNVSRPVTADLRIDLAESYHPFWHAEPPVPLAQAKDGLMVVGPLPAGVTRVELVYASPKAPWVVSLVAGAAMVVIALAGLGQRARAWADRRRARRS